jgi:CheY-like chemotaxis protein
MDWRKVKILWIDDDIDRLKLQPYLDGFEDRGFEIIKVANPDDVDKAIESNSDIQCIILDISMPTGESFGAKESKGGMRTGLLVLGKLVADARIASAKKVIFTIVSNDEVKEYCDFKGIPCLLKQDYVASSFVAKIKEIIGK